MDTSNISRVIVGKPPNWTKCYTFCNDVLHLTTYNVCAKDVLKLSSADKSHKKIEKNMTTKKQYVRDT